MNNITPLYKDKSFVICFCLIIISFLSLWYIGITHTNFVLTLDDLWNTYMTNADVRNFYGHDIYYSALAYRDNLIIGEVISLIIFIASLVLTITMGIGYLDYYRGLIVEVIQYETKPIIKTVIKNRPKQKIKPKTYTQEIVELKNKVIEIT